MTIRYKGYFFYIILQAMFYHKIILEIHCWLIYKTTYIYMDEWMNEWMGHKNKNTY